MARSNIAGQPAITRAGAYDSEAAKQMQNVTCNGTVLHLTGSADPIQFPSIVSIDSSGVDATTLATPVSGEQPAGDDGKTILIVDTGGHAHTVTTAANAIINSKHILTFNGTIGSNVMLKAVAGIWVIVGTSLGVAVS
jgi:hypothetical protein